MFCPNYTNKEVFDAFNEIVEALGGRPMTDEEFRNKDVRLQRTGADLHAAMVAYRVWNRNQGNPIDEAPNGLKSILFLSLLDHFGDRLEAIIAKTNVYSDEFFNWFGDWTHGKEIDDETRSQISLIFRRIPELANIGTQEQYALYILTIFPNSIDKSIYWHGSDADFSQGFESAKRTEGSGAPETKSRNDFYLAKQAWSVLQYVSGVNRKSIDKNGFAHWNKLWWELKEIMSNGRRENGDWKNLIINETNVRQAIPNKKGVFNRDSGGLNGKWLSERKADYGYENKSDREFFEEILGIKYGLDTFNTWVQRNSEIFKQLESLQKGIYPAVINTTNPIRESGLNTYYEEQRGLFTRAERDDNDAILGSNTDNEFGSDVAVVINASDNNVHFLGTKRDIEEFKNWVKNSSVSKVIDSNGEPLVVWIGTSGVGRKKSNPFKRSQNAILASVNQKDALKYGFTNPVYMNIKYDYSDYVNQDNLSNFIKQYDNLYLEESEGPYEDVNKHKLAGVNLPDNIGIINTKQYQSGTPSDYIVSKANQIKHVENLGTWNPGTANIYNAPQITEIPDPFQAMSLTDVFTEDLLQKLLNGDTVSSQELVNQLLTKDGIFTGRYFDLAQVLSRHDVPIRLTEIDLGFKVLASTIYNPVDRSRVILINREEISRITKLNFGETLLHEMVHAITEEALTNPSNREGRILRTKATDAFNTIRGLFEKQKGRIISGIGDYGLMNVDEFVAVFATDYEARREYFAIAKEIDQKFDNTFLGKFRDFVNALARVFVNKNILKSNEETLQDYENYFANYINNTPTIRKGNINENSSLRDVYNEQTKTLLENEAINRALLNLGLQLDYFKKQNFELSALFKGLHFTKDLPNSSNLETIKSSLHSRINALKNANLPESVKQQLLLTAQTQLGMFENQEVSNYEAVAYLLDTLKPAIISAVEELKNINSLNEITANSSNYLFHQHQNIGWFNIVLMNMSSMLTNEAEIQSMVSQHNKNKTDEEKINREAITALDNYIKELSLFVTLANNILDNILDRAAMEDFKNAAAEAGSIEAEELITGLKSASDIFKSDISWLEMTFGQADAATNEMVRAAAHIIKTTDDVVTEKLIEKGDVLIRLQKLLKSGESVRDLYEMDNGKATLYLVRKINFGKFEKDYRKFLAELNKKYGLDPANVTGPTDEQKRISWEIEKNNWLNNHCHRKYTAAYYNAWAKVPMHVKAKLDKINGSISAILDKYGVVDEDGYYHYDKIPETDEGKEDWQTLQNLWHAKKEMRSPYTITGEEKQGEEKAVADVLNNLYKELYGDKYKERNKNISKWKSARAQTIKECGGQELYDKYLRGEPNTFDAKKLDKWDARNSRYQFKKDANGDAIVFKMIEQEMQGFKFNYGEEYEKLKEKVNDLLRPAYDLAGQVNVDFLSSKTKKELADLYQKMYIIRKKVIASHPGYRTLEKRYARILEDYIKYADTRYMQQIKQNVSHAVEEMYGSFDIELFTLMMSEWGRSYDILGFPVFKPYNYLQVGIAKDADYMEWVPNDAWAEQEEDDRYVNKEFDKSFGESRVPFQHLYDNSKAWLKIQNSQTLLELYEELVNTLAEANLMQTNRNWTNKYRLPGVSMQLYERFKRNTVLSWPLVLFKWLKEKIGIVDNSEEDIILKDRTTSNDDNTSEGDEIKSTQTSIIGAQPDGTRYMALPLYYTRRMKNPENISYELLDIVLSYYKMSLNYSERLKIRDTLETLADFIKKNSSPTSEETTKLNKIVRKITSSEDVSNLYKQMRNLLDMGLYNKVRTEYKLGWFKLSTTFSTVQQYTTAVNLGWNKKVAAVGFMTAMFNHLLNACVGKEYGLRSLTEAMGIVTTHVVMQFAKNQFYSKTPTDKLLVIMKNFNIANQLDRNYENTSQGKLARVWLQNHTFGYLASVDYLTKSLITVACLKDYKLIDGKFYSSYDIKMLLHDLERYKKLLTAYNKAKSAYDLININDKGLIYFKSEDILNAWKRDKSRIIAKCQKQSEKADGVCTGLQRAAVQRSWIGMFLMIHRQYLPLMMHERWGQRIYDYDTQEYTHGLFRVFAQYLKELSMNTLLPGLIAGAGVGYFFGGQFGAGIGALVALGLRARGKMKGMNKSFSQINKEFFNSFNNQKETIRSVENLFAIKLIILENILFAMMRYLVVNPICALADDDKDNWFLQSIAYWLKATLFEISVAYNFSDLTSNIKSPTAATVLLDRLTYLGDQSISDLWAWCLYGLSLSDKEPKLIGKNSPYEGWTRWQKGLFLFFTPLHNEWEQDTPKGVKFKRTYLENQIISESDADKFNFFDLFSSSE